jgi:hypothetical protein
MPPRYVRRFCLSGRKHDLLADLGFFYPHPAGFKHMNSFFGIAGAVIITLLGVALAAITKSLPQDRPRPPSGYPSAAQRPGVLAMMTEQDLAPRRSIPWSGSAVLVVFLIVVLAFGAISIFKYWSQIVANRDDLFFFGWLLLSMIAGMFARVLADNHKNGCDLLDVRASQLVYPLIFTVLVFYVVWAMVSTAPHNFFAIYAAFLNGYFWETVVSQAKAPA